MDPLDYLGPPELILDPWDLVSTPWTIWDPWTTWDPRDLSETVGLIWDPLGFLQMSPNQIQIKFLNLFRTPGPHVGPPGLI